MTARIELRQTSICIRPLQTQDFMSENILAWRDARWEGKRVGAILRGKAFAGPGNGFVGVVAGLVDFYPDGAGAAGEGGAGTRAGG